MKTHRHYRYGGRRRRHLTELEGIAVLAFYANPMLRIADIASAVGLYTDELNRLLKLKDGKELFDRFAGYVPTELMSEYHISENRTPPKAVKDYRQQMLKRISARLRITEARERLERELFNE